MSLVVIFGAGPIGSAIAQRLAEHNRVNQVLFIDDNKPVAEGKALDIRQSGPIGGYDTRLSAEADPLAAVSADVIVLADDTASGAWDGDRGLTLIGRLLRAGVTAPFVFAAPSQTSLLETAARELHVASDRLIGTAASAVGPMVASLVNIELGQTGTSVCVTGRPPAFVVGWSAATIDGALVSERVPPHRLLAISQSLGRLWPPGPQAISAPTALVDRGADRRIAAAAAGRDDPRRRAGRARPRRPAAASNSATDACFAATSRPSVRRNGRRRSTRH